MALKVRLSKLHFISSFFPFNICWILLYITTNSADTGQSDGCFHLNAAAALAHRFLQSTFLLSFPGVST